MARNAPSATGSSASRRKSRNRNISPIPTHAPTQALRVCVRINATTSAGMTIAVHARLCRENSSRATAAHATSISSPEYVM